MKESIVLAYRIEPIERFDHFHIGDVLTSPLKNDDSNLSELKRNIEDIFESTRQSLFEDLPSRKNALFVIPFDMEYVYRWADTKYTRYYAEYTLLTLRLEGNLFWFNADIYNDVLIPFNTLSKEELARKYWAGIGESYQETELVEGLFTGNAYVERIDKLTHEALQ